MRYMALQGDQGSVLFRWTKRGAIMWCLPMGPKSRAQGLESSCGMLRTCPAGERNPKPTLASVHCPPARPVPPQGLPPWPSAPLPLSDPSLSADQRGRLRGQLVTSSSQGRPCPYSLKIFGLGFTLGFSLAENLGTLISLCFLPQPVLVLNESLPHMALFAIDLPRILTVTASLGQSITTLPECLFHFGLSLVTPDDGPRPYFNIMASVQGGNGESTVPICI